MTDHRIVNINNTTDATSSAGTAIPLVMFMLGNIKLSVLWFAGHGFSLCLLFCRCTCQYFLVLSAMGFLFVVCFADVLVSPSLSCRSWFVSLSFVLPMYLSVRPCLVASDYLFGIFIFYSLRERPFNLKRGRVMVFS